ncbi:MAG: hypothetical protein NT062_07155 [Proteobacteria bacterium]|nr:hypothetical protein [Pseudomonadota bacterium]
MFARLLLVTLTSGCLIPLASPSARIEGGMAMSTHQSARGTIRAGAHVVGNRTASDATWDLGAGYVGVAPGTDDVDHMPVAGSNGGYLEGSYLRRVGTGARFGIGPGVQLNLRDHAVLPVGYLRASFELFTPVSASGTESDTCTTVTGTWHGQAGIGTYVDVQRPFAERGVTVVAGLTLRLPAFAGVALVIPGCK